jgi:hypothetical protein
MRRVDDLMMSPSICSGSEGGRQKNLPRLRAISASKIAPYSVFWAIIGHRADSCNCRFLAAFLGDFLSEETVGGRGGVFIVLRYVVSSIIRPCHVGWQNRAIGTTFSPTACSISHRPAGWCASMRLFTIFTKLLIGTTPSEPHAERS